MRSWRGGMLEEAIEHEFYAEVVGGTAEEDGRGVAGEDGVGIKGFAGVFEHVEFLGDFIVGGVVEAFADDGVGKVADGNGRAELAANSALEEMHLVLMPVEDAFEISAVADGPVDG